MTVNTKKVTGRREVRYESFDELLADAEKLANCDIKTLGNLSYGEILDHIAAGMQATLDGFGFKAPLPMRLIANTFMKKKFLRGGIPAGFQRPQKFPEPKDVPVEEALANLRRQIERLESTEDRSPHPVFGKMDKADADQFQLRHAELHMSFVVPVE